MERFRPSWEKAQAATLAFALPFLAEPALAQESPFPSCGENFTIGTPCLVRSFMCDEKTVQWIEDVKKVRAGKEEQGFWTALAQKDCPIQIGVFEPIQQTKSFKSPSGLPIHIIKVKVNALCEVAEGANGARGLACQVSPPDTVRYIIAPKSPGLKGNGTAQAT